MDNNSLGKVNSYPMVMGCPSLVVSLSIYFNEIDQKHSLIDNLWFITGYTYIKLLIEIDFMRWIDTIVTDI